MALSEYQIQRVADVRQWYETVYCSLEDHTHKSIRYMALWAVFNALYNIADYPKVKLRSVKTESGGEIKPSIRGRTEDKKLRFISRRFVQDNQFTVSLIQDNREFINYLFQRTPHVQQPPGITSIEFNHDNQNYSLNLTNIRGIASLDNRKFLQNGAVLFQYHHLDLDLNADGLPRDRQKFYRQIVFMLYQLRNNIVHGGSAAFFLEKTELAERAITLLECLVQHLFDRPNLLWQENT